MLWKPMSCSFCGRRHTEVAKLVAGPMRMLGRVYLCDRCAARTIEIMEGSSGDERPREKPPLLRRTLGWLNRGYRRDVASGSECHGAR
jgi:ClpX C4-type zinc finger